MKTLKKYFAFFLLFLPFYTKYAYSVPEIPINNLPDVSIASWYSGYLPPYGNYNGPIIYYNPTTIAMVGPVLSAFFKAHEYCHISLNHIQQILFASNPYNRAWMSQNLELQADSCATQTLISQGNVTSPRAAMQWFYGQGPVLLDFGHPPGTARADNIRNTAWNMGVTL